MTPLCRWWKRFKEEIAGLTRVKWIIMGSIGAFFVAVAVLIAVGHILNQWSSELPQIPDKILKLIPPTDVRFLTRCGLVASISFFVAGALSYRLWFALYCFLITGWWLLWRSVATALWPIAPPAGIIIDQSLIEPARTFWELVYNGLISPQVLFFSGHTGLPILGFLIFNEVFNENRKRPIACGYLSVPLLVLWFFYLDSSAYPFWLCGILILATVILAAGVWRRKRVKFHQIFLGWSVIMAASVLLTHQHYFGDVVFAIPITYFLWVSGRWIFGTAERFSITVENKLAQIQRGAQN